MPVFFHQANPPQVHHISNSQMQSITVNLTDAKQLTNFLTAQIPSQSNPKLMQATEGVDKLKQGKSTANNRTASTTVPAKPGETQMYYTTEFGYVPLPKTLNGLKLLLASEAVTFYDHPPDLANFYYAIYYQFGESVLKQIADAHLLPSAVSGRHYHEQVYGTPDRIFVNANGKVVSFVPGAPNTNGEKPPQETVYYPNY